MATENQAANESSAYTTTPIMLQTFVKDKPLVALARLAPDAKGTFISPMKLLEGLPWSTIEAGWIYVTGPNPVTMDNAVTAAAEGSTVIQYASYTATGPRVRNILVETQGKKPGKVSKTGATPPSQDFLNDTPSYIDVFLVGAGTIDPPQPFTMPDLTQATPPPGFDADLWDELKEVDGVLQMFGLKWHKGTVGH